LEFFEFAFSPAVAQWVSSRRVVLKSCGPTLVLIQEPTMRSRRFPLAAAVLAGWLGVAAVHGQETTGFVNRVYQDAESGTHKYAVFVPQGYTRDKAWPCILFLHGAGERGDDGVLQTKVGLAPAIRKREKTFPFLAVFPQCKSSGRWLADSRDGQRAMAILGAVQKEFHVDGDRVYLTGLSLGGMGTWSLGTKYPERWAALVPVCGRGEPAQADRIKNLPVWCFHGDADRAVSVEGSRAMIKALEATGAKPRYTEYPGVGHNSWDAAYGTDELYTWLLEQRRAK
jgi:predicted peptidase